MIRPGKKTKNWQKGRNELKKIFEEHGITTCEAMLPPCWYDNALSFAHDAKRRKLTPEETVDPHRVALLCIPCHSRIEVLPAEEMEAFIQEIVSKRGW